MYNIMIHSTNKQNQYFCLYKICTEDKILYTYYNIQVPL